MCQGRTISCTPNTHNIFFFLIFISTLEDRFGGLTDIMSFIDTIIIFLHYNSIFICVISKRKRKNQRSVPLQSWNDESTLLCIIIRYVCVAAIYHTILLILYNRFSLFFRHNKIKSSKLETQECASISIQIYVYYRFVLHCMCVLMYVLVHILAVFLFFLF